ncbi:Uncharacterised protein [Mycobacterium tuberculosis]|nr:Uncharacterised protein [Mycobacterium tuberculosis]
MGYLLPARGDAVRGRQTQNPERGGNHRGSPALDHAPLVVSSDPKPREGTETCANPFGVMRMVGSGRQTQNPERGGNFVDHHCHSLSPRVVRPKTPRGDGNLE